MKKVLVVSSVASALAGQIEVVSSDISSRGIGLDNIKAKVSQSLRLFNQDTTLTAEYDRNANRDGLHETSLSGSVKKIKYEVTQSGDSTELKLEADTPGGMTVEAVGDYSAPLGYGLKTVTASRTTSFGDQAVEAEYEHSLKSGDSKLKLSTILGNGITAIANIANAKGGGAEASYELEYEGTLTEGRTLSANVKVADGSGEVEYEDSATLASQDSTITATMPLGGTPKVTVKRSWSF